MVLIVFDVDGTLIDSQATILKAMTAGFDAVGLPMPARAQALSVVGLSLPIALSRLAPDVDDATLDTMVATYREAYVSDRGTGGAEEASPLFPGTLEVLQDLGARDEVVLGIATGKSRRGLDHLLALHDLKRHFITLQTADGHPSKPHPAMLEAAMADAGINADAAIMIGDTTFDIDMAVNAGMTGIGVSWGYHAPEALRLSGAVTVLDRFDGLVPYLTQEGWLA